MDIKEIQKELMDFVNKRIKKEKTQLTPEISYIHLTEEVGELARQLFNKNFRKDSYDERNVKEEIADVILESLALASLFNMDLEKELLGKIDNLNKKHGLK